MSGQGGQARLGFQEPGAPPASQADSFCSRTDSAQAAQGAGCPCQAVGNGGRANGRERGQSVAGGPRPGVASLGSRGPSRAPLGLCLSGDLRGKEKRAVSSPDMWGPYQERPQAGLAGIAPWADAS